VLKSKWFWILLVVVLAVAGGGYYYYDTQMVAAAVETSDEPAMQTAVARRGDLVIYASGAGQLVPAAEIGVGFEESGTLIEINVAVGDQVHYGDLLARLQTNKSEEEIAAEISDAELTVIKAQQSLDDLYTSAESARISAMSNISTYAQALRDAEYQLENYTLPTYLQGLETIEALDMMKEELDAASEAFEPYRYYAADDPIRRELLEALNEAQSRYNAAVKRLDYEYEMQVAQANLAQARTEYEQYQNGPAADELALAQAELANAEAKLELAKEAQAVVDLVAPFDGTVMTLDASVGEAIGTTAIITLANLEQPTLDVYIDETDLDKVAAGYEVEVVFDALPDDVFNGKVVSVNPALETVANVQAVKIVVVLDVAQFESDMILPVGLNASVDIIAGRAMGAVLVPVEALRELGPGEYAVFVMENDEPVLRVVEVGIMDITYAEITSGLQAGEIVTTGIVQAE
jgi:RND family efflux transporter MFP subunit